MPVKPLWRRTSERQLAKCLEESDTAGALYFSEVAVSGTAVALENLKSLRGLVSAHIVMALRRFCAYTGGHARTLSERELAWKGSWLICRY